MRQDTEIIEALRRRQAAIEMHSSLSWPNLSPASASLLNGPTLMRALRDTQSIAPRAQYD
jgi:hypothetical protein